MSETLPKVLLTFRIGGENGGPYVSHQRIMESSLRQKYNIQPLMIENPRKLRRPKVFLSMVKQIKRERPDIVHLAGLGSEGFLMMLACRLAKVKTVVAVHGSATEAIGYNRLDQIIFRFIENYTVRKADAVYGVSDYVSSWKVCRKISNYFGTVYNLPSYEHEYSQNRSIRKELGIDFDDIVVVSTGRIVKDKGFDTLLNVILNLKDCNNIKFVIAGDGDFRENMQNELRVSGAEKNTFLLGYRKDINEILGESDIFVICTKHETLCISLLEAGSNSLPLIASNVGGIPEIINNGENGFLIDPYDVNGFSDAILSLAKNNEMRKRMGSAAKASIDDKFNAQKILSKLGYIYQTVLEKQNG